MTWHCAILFQQTSLYLKKKKTIDQECVLDTYLLKFMTWIDDDDQVVLTYNK